MNQETDSVSSPDHLLLERRPSGECRITINRPDKHNPLARDLLAKLAQAVREAADAPETRLIVITGAGERYFAAGGDLRDLANVREVAATTQMANQARHALDAVRDCPLPVLAYLNGDAIGGGAELALACDMRLQAAHARIGFVQARLAITSAWGGGSDLCRLIGTARAMRMMSRAELIDAPQALAWGLADAIIENGPDGEDMNGFLKPMLACPVQVLRGIKAQTRAARRGASDETRRAIEQHHLIETWLHDDHWRAADKILSKGKS